MVVYQNSQKYIYSTDGAHELYALGQDTEEQLNLAESQPEQAASLQKLLEEALRARGLGLDSIGAGTLSEQEMILSPEDAEHLKELGYIDGEE